MKIKTTIFLICLFCANVQAAHNNSPIVEEAFDEVIFVKFSNLLEDSRTGGSLLVRDEEGSSFDMWFCRDGQILVRKFQPRDMQLLYINGEKYLFWEEYNKYRLIKYNKIKLSDISVKYTSNYEAMIRGDFK